MSDTKHTATRRIHQDVLYVAGRGNPETADIMFVAPAVHEEEAQEDSGSRYGVRVKEKAEYLKGPIGVLFKDIALENGIDITEKQYFTAVCKWLLPTQGLRNKPATKALKWGMPVLEDEIRRVKPKIIVCLGKPAYDMLSPEKISMKDAHGSWIWSEKYNALLYLMYNPVLLLTKPEIREMFRVDLQEVKRRYDILVGNPVHTQEVREHVIRDSHELRSWMMERLVDGSTLFSLDCEWHGSTHVDGELRSMQLAWTEEDAIYIRFMDDELNYVFDLTYEETGRLLMPLLGRPDVKYIGHHYAADSVWLHHWLKLPVFNKCVLDTEFAQQTIDEHSELGLERGIAMKYTTLGCYNQDLLMWKRKHKKLCEDGYGLIPDDILIPYACLRGESQVQLGDGSWRPIRHLVNTRYDGMVKAMVDGEVKDCRVTGWKKTRKRGQTWFRLQTGTSRFNHKGVTGPVFTPDHEIVTHRGKVRVDELKIGEDRIVTDEKLLSDDQVSVILGSLLGDGGIARRNSAGSGIRFSQRKDRKAYAEWKAETLSSVMGFTSRTGGTQEYFCSSYIRQLVGLESKYPRHSVGQHSKRKLIVSTEVLDRLGAVGLAVWYQDDGVFTRDKTCRIICRKLTVTEQEEAVTWLIAKLGSGVHYDTVQGALIFNREASKRFLSLISGYMHPVMGYKSDLVVGGELGDVCTDSGELYAEVITGRVEAKRGKNAGHDTRFCLTVPEAGNFLTKAGFVSNCKDVIAVYRAMPQIRQRMKLQGLEGYYDNIFNPFVTDVFTMFALTGLPMDIPLMDDLRELFNYADRRLTEKFRRDIHIEARGLFLRKMMELSPGIMPGLVCQKMDELFESPNPDAVWDWVKESVGSLENIKAIDPFFLHLQESPGFNLRSSPSKTRWLFEVCGYTPVKSTNQKAEGRPSMAWEKVLALPADRQKLYKPAADKQTLTIIAQKAPLVEQLLELTMVGNLCKAFLKESTTHIDDDGNTVEDEAGIHKWLASNGRVHGMSSTTATGRPRSWKPNVLNWPSYVNDKIIDNIKKVLVEDFANGTLPESLAERWRYVIDAKEDEKVKLPSIRSCVCAPKGNVLQETSYFKKK